MFKKRIARVAVLMVAIFSMLVGVLPGRNIIIAKEPVVLAGNVSAYTSDPAETDDTPFITAGNTKTRIGIVANNSLPCFSKVEIDGKVYSVEDRMNRRYGKNHFDIWFSQKSEALEFGRRKLKIIIYQ